MAPPRTFGGVDCAGAVDDAFWAWATAEGVEAVSCAPALFREGWRGVAATGDVAPGDVVLRVPGSLLMSARSAALDPDLAAALETHGGALTPAERLSCHLLHEASKGAHSRWRAYVRQLPRRYNLLASWTAGEIEALQAPDAIAVAERVKAEMRASHIKALTVLKHLGLPPPFRAARAWTWARCTVSSRTVFVPFDDAGALCPVGDLFNYAPPPASHSVDVLGTPLGTEELAALLSGRTRGAENFAAPSSKKNDENALPDSVDFSAGDGSYDAALDAYVFYARRRYERGDQIMLCYGKHTNLSLLEHYGFLLPPGSTNANDAAPLAPVPGFGAGEFRKIHHRVSADARGRLTWTSLADLRADAADADADVRRLGLAKRARDVCRRGKAVSPAVERRVFEAVRDAAGRTLLSLATTAAQDEEAIAAARDEERKSAALESTDGLGAEARTDATRPWTSTARRESGRAATASKTKTTTTTTTTRRISARTSPTRGSPRGGAWRTSAPFRRRIDSRRRGWTRRSSRWAPRGEGTRTLPRATRASRSPGSGRGERFFFRRNSRSAVPRFSTVVRYQFHEVRSPFA